MTYTPFSLSVPTKGKGLHDITSLVKDCLAKTGVQCGMCFVFLRHTSASLVISENFDPSARRDLQTFMDRLVPEGQEWMIHDDEGPDDSPSHMRAMLTRTTESIPVVDGQLALGTWQGIYVFEHRSHSHLREVIVQVHG